jgi:hypothetical protein
MDEGRPINSPTSCTFSTAFRNGVHGLDPASDGERAHVEEESQECRLLPEGMVEGHRVEPGQNPRVGVFSQHGGDVGYALSEAPSQ